MSMQPGWYPDPFSSGGYVRWWDGQRWGASAAAPADAAPAAGAASVGSVGVDPLAPVPMPPPRTPGGPAYGAPYGAPAGAPVATFPLATWGSRALARILDTLVESVLVAPVLGWLLWPAFGDLLDSVPDGAAPSQAALDAFQEQLLSISVTLSLVSAAVTFLYEVPQNVLWGRTLGKRAMGLRIRPLAQDAPLSWVQATVRWGTYTVGSLVAGGFFTIIDYLWPLWDKPWRQALHDKTAKTVVVPTS